MRVAVIVAVCVAAFGSVVNADDTPEDTNPALPAGADAVTIAGTRLEIPFSEDSAPLPESYTLQTYDDCGAAGRCPHIVDGQTYVFPVDHVDAPPPARSVAFSPTGTLVARYRGLKANTPYVVVVTYSSEAASDRRQALYAGEHMLHGPRDLPRGQAERYAIDIPAHAIVDGELSLEFRRVKGPNPVVAEIELWAPLPAPAIIHLEPWHGQDDAIKGRVTDLRFRPLAGASVHLSVERAADATQVVASDNDGVFGVDAVPLRLDPADVVTINVQSGAAQVRDTFRARDLLFFPPRYRPIADAVAGTSTCQLLLDGEWQAKAQPEAGFVHRDASDADGWREFSVPGQLVQQGWPVSNDSVFGLVHEFELPHDWAGQPVFLRFEAIHGVADCFLNGVLLGRSEFVYTPIEFDVSKVAKPGTKNRLAVRLDTDANAIADRLASSSLYAHHNPAGIHRPVRVFTLPRTHFARVWLDPRVNEACDAAELRVDLDLHVNEAAPALAAKLTLTNPDGDVVPLEQDTFPLSTSQASGHRETIRCRIDAPQLWSAETPQLYELQISLLDGQTPLETVRRTIGFRRIEVRGDRVLVNGVPIKLFGANRHEIDPRTGRANTARHAAQDARLFKEANCNYIRTSHYPPTREFLEACDRIGIYVECEAPFCWTHKEPEEDDPRFRREFLHPTVAMLEYHHAHPSIIVWSLGNESGWNKPRLGIPCNYAATNTKIKQLDPARPTAFNNSYGNDGQLCDIVVTHYPPAEDFAAWLVYPDESRPVLIDEFLHVMCYNVEELRVDPGVTEEWARGLPRFGACDNRDFWDPNSIWNRIYKNDRYLGLAIWGGIDEVFHLPNGTTCGYGPWGLIDGWRRRKTEWWHTRMMYAPVWIPQRQVDYDKSTGQVRIPIENRYSFIDLSELTMRWQVAGERGSLTGPAIPPLSRGTLEFDLSPGLRAGTELTLDVQNRTGRSIVTWGLDLGVRPARRLDAPAGGAPQWERSGASLRIAGDDYCFEVDTTTGVVTPCAGGRTPLLATLPMIHATQAERRMGFTPNAPPYMELPRADSRKIESVTVTRRDNALAIVVRDKYDDFRGTVEWLLDRHGRGLVTYSYTYSGPPRELREVGVKVRLDASCQSLRWRSRGLWGVYPEDHIGRRAGFAEAHGPAHNAVSSPGTPPTWPWSLDENELGTRDFRSTKFNVYDATLVNADDRGVRVAADADVNVRACLDADGVVFHCLQARQARAVSADATLVGHVYMSIVP